MQTEFVRNLHNNYERLLLDKKPEERKYQYCILSRGGIKGLLPCSLRYLNGLAYLYYDITSRQNMVQLYGRRSIDRQWMQDFMWSFQHIRQELERFLLDDKNILWYPEQIFQDLEKNIFSFLYVPYYEGENGFRQLIEFWVEHIDYEDEDLVEYVYKMYEQYEQNGAVYLQEQIFEDAKILERAAEETIVKSEEPLTEQRTVNEEAEVENPEEEKRGFLRLLEGRKRKNREMRGHYRQDFQQPAPGYAVAEETIYEEEEYGKTIYIEETAEEEEKIHRLYTPDGKLLAQLEHPIFSIGKKKGEADLVLDDLSVSRVHARILQEKESVYLEDMNSTNGTYKNGLRLQPYEKRKLEEEDEIKVGKQILVYR